MKAMLFYSKQQFPNLNSFPTCSSWLQRRSYISVAFVYV